MAALGPLTRGGRARGGPLRQPAFRNLWLAGLISDAGDWMLLVALPIVVYARTGSTLGTAAAFLAELGPMIVLAPLGGVLADRLDRRRLLAMIAVAQALALLPLLFVGDHGRIGLIYAVIVVQAGLGALFDPARNALLPALIPPERLVSANSLVGLGAGAGRLAGGPLGGLLLAAGDLNAIVAVDAISFVVAAVLVLRVTAAPAAQEREERGGATAARGQTRVGGDGLGGPANPDSVTAGSSTVTRALLVLAPASIAQGIFVVLFVVFVARRLDGGAGEIGILRGVQAIGAIAAGLVLVAFARRPDAGRLIAGASLAFGTISLTVWNLPAVTTGPAAYVVLFAIVGAPGVVFEVGLLTILARAVPDRRRGRVMGAAAATEATGQALGMIAAGLLPGMIGLDAVLDSQAALYLGAGVLAALILRRSSLAHGALAPG